MTAIALTELLADCEAHGIRLSPTGDGGLTIDAPRDDLTPALMSRLKAHKPVLLALVPPGWPVDVPIPTWWPEFVKVFPAGFFSAARPACCLGPECGFSVAVQWTHDGNPIWSCPKCGLNSVDQSVLPDPSSAPVGTDLHRIAPISGIR